MKISHPENIDINSISTLIFDWGGVITPISPEAAIQAFKDLGHSSIENFFDPGATEDIFFRLETGDVTPSEVYDKLNEGLPGTTDPALLEKAYCKLLLDTPPVRIELLKRLRGQFQLCLLSNTNRIHTLYYNKVLLDKHRINFPAIFHKIFYSYDLGLRKPGAAIFEKVIREHDIPVDSTLFLDDTIPNITTARSLGIRSVWVDDQHPIEKIFADWL